MSHDIHAHCERDYQQLWKMTERTIGEKVNAVADAKEAHAKEVRALEEKIRDLEHEVECLNETLEEERKAQDY